NAGEDRIKELGGQHIGNNTMFLERTFGASESLLSFDTCQFDDYPKVYAPRWDPEQKARRRSEVFPVDCQHAFEMGSRPPAE
ncbi:MAG: flavodoxin family protein, partial [Syntrophorhabdales bacterium]